MELLYALVKKGAHEKFVRTSTAELASECCVSQQTASRKLIELEQNGFIERKVDRRGQAIVLTQKALTELKSVYKNLAPVFGIPRKHKLTIEGRLFSGLGEGKYYISLSGYKKQFVRKLEFDPYPGTLNLKLESQKDMEAKVSLEKIESTEIDGFEDKKRSYGRADCYKTLINGLKAAIIIVERTHHNTDVIEVISPHYLRKKLRLKDGDMIKVDVL